MQIKVKDYFRLTKARIKRRVIKGRLRLESYNILIKRRLEIFLNFLSNWAITLASFLIMILLSTPYLLSHTSEITSLNNYFIACATIIGTVFALVVTLAIIPIQYASGLTTAKIASGYFKDKTTRFVIVFIGSNVILLLAASLLPVPPVNPFVMVWLLFLMTGFSLDLIRLYFRKIVQLLEPYEAIKVFVKDSQDYITKISNYFDSIAKGMLSLAPADQKSPSLVQTQALIYNDNGAHQNNINDTIDQLSEACRKALSRGDVILSNKIIYEIGQLIKLYLKRRRNNLYFSQDLTTGKPVTVSDGDTLLISTYETLLALNNHAILCNHEDVSIQVCRTFGEIADSTTKISPLKLQSELPLAHSPLYFMLLCIEFGREKGLTEIGFQSFGILKDLFINWPAKKEIWHSLSQVLVSWEKTSIRFLLEGNTVLANGITEYIFTIIYSIRRKKHSEFAFIFREVIQTLELIVKLSITKAVAVNTNDHISKPYEVSSGASFYRMIIDSANSLKVDEDREYISPYGEFTDLNEVVRLHFSDIAQAEGFDECFIFTQVIFSIESIQSVYIQLMDQKITDDPSHMQELVDSAKYYLHVFGWAAHKSKFRKAQYFDMAADLITWIGLQFGSRDHRTILFAATRELRGLIKSHIKNREHVDSFFIADIQVYILKLRFFQEHFDKTRFDDQKLIVDLLEHVSPELKLEIAKNIKLRNSQFWDKFERHSQTHVTANKSTYLLAQLFQSRQETNVKVKNNKSDKSIP